MSNLTSWESLEGSSYPLGLSYIPSEEAFNFAIYSRHATNVSLLIYNEENFTDPIYRYDFDYKINKSNRIWHCRIKAAHISAARYYAYVIDGPPPADKFEWHTFDKNKILLDPYSKSVFFPPLFNSKAARMPGSNKGMAPLGSLLKEESLFDWGDDRFIRHEQDLIIYELHVKGFTYHASSGLQNDIRGTFRGIIEKIPYFKELGITAVELMPVHQFVTDNEYWGYNTLNFFSPHSEYSSSPDPIERIIEFKTMVRELHKANIEVILDVVYNHTGEGGMSGPMYSFKGIDNSTYYLISDNPDNPYYDYSGTGNTMHTRNNSVRRLILDSLHYWRNEMHIDGFRFDLASVFSRNIDGSISFEEPAVLGMIGSDPDIATARFIAEPWDATGANYLGKKFPGVKWMQWNSAFRDDVRHFVKSDGYTECLRNRIYGSSDIFPDDLINSFHVYQSINYVNSHDGFTLYDLVSYNKKHNEVNGLNNTDGANDNVSWNCGVEGDSLLTDDILTLRKQQAKNFCTILFLANGTPMLVAGDEFLRTQKGNNNPFNQDNETSWIDWGFKEKNEDFFNFFKKMISFRKRHPSISRSRFWQTDVQWFGRSGAVDYSGPPSLAFYLNGASEQDDDIYVMINAHWEAHSFTFQQHGPWFRVVNTSLKSPHDFIDEGSEKVTNIYLVGARSVAVFVKTKAL